MWIYRKDQTAIKKVWLGHYPYGFFVSEMGSKSHVELFDSFFPLKLGVALTIAALGLMHYNCFFNYWILFFLDYAFSNRAMGNDAGEMHRSLHVTS